MIRSPTMLTETLVELLNRLEVLVMAMKFAPRDLAVEVANRAFIILGPLEKALRF